MKLSSTFERGPVRLRAKTCRACPLYGSSTFVAVVSGHRFPAINVDTSFVDTSFVIRTTDGGDTWDSVGNFPKDVRAFLYAEGDATNLFCETNLGVWVSNDTGSNWRPICGPSRFVEPGAEDTIQLSYLTTPSDTTTFQQHYPADLSSPLYFHDSRLFVADGTGGLWQLDTASLAPRLSLSEAAVAFDATPCTPKDTAVILTGEDFCQALPVTRLSASIEGSAAFLLDTIHRIGAVSDTVHIRYAPSIGSHDSARVHLRYSIGNRIIDTTIRVVGTSIFEPQPIVFAGQFREQSVPLGVTATLDISGNQTVSGKGLTQIAFDLLYNTDLLELTEASSSIAGTTVSADPIYVGGGTRQTGVHLSVRGNELTLDSALSFLKLDFRTYITDTLATSAVITNLHLKNGDPSFERCVLQASGSGASVSVTGACSDSILSQYLRVRSLVLAAIHPNPATDEIYLDCYSPTDADVRVELFGATGSQLYSTMRQLRAGWNSIRVSTTGIPSGTNTVRMSNLRTVRTEKFIIQR